MHRLLPPAAALLSAAALSGCGSHASATGAEFAQQANARCTTSRAQLAKLPRPASLLGMHPYLDRAVPILESERKAVGGLPGAGGSKASALLRAWDHVLEASRSAAAASRTVDDARIAVSMKATHTAKLAADAAAQAAGARACTGFSPFEYDKR